MSQGARPIFQKRSQETRDKLVKALENLLHKKSFEELTVSEIAAEAGVSPGSIYRRFKNKEAFIPVLFEIYLVRMEEWSKRPEAQAELEDFSNLRNALKFAANAVWAQLTDQAHILKAVYIYVRLRPELMGQEWEKWEKQSLEAFTAIIDHFSDEIKHKDKKKAASMVTLLFNTVFVEYGLFEQENPNWDLDMDGEEFAQEVADMAYGYLTL